MEPSFDSFEKFFFVDSNGQVNSYLDEDGIKKYKFVDAEKRLSCVEKFLAYHSFDLGNNNPVNNLSLSFNNDKELYDAMINPEKYKDKIVDNINDESNDESNKESNNFINVTLKVNDFEKEFQINTFELYSEVLLPWVVKNKDDSPLLIYLSRLQKEMFFDKDVKIDFYPTDKGFEPVITNHQFKNTLLEKIISAVLKHLNREIGEGEILMLEFRNGDRDILSAWAGTIRYKYYQIVNLDSIKDMEYYENLKTMDKAVLILTYIPDTNKILYYGISK